MSLFSCFNFDSYKKRNIRIASIIIVSFLTFSQFVIIVCPIVPLVSLSPPPRGGREGALFLYCLEEQFLKVHWLFHVDDVIEENLVVVDYRHVVEEKLNVLYLVS